MEHLTKSQIILLTLFVSFVASMATGIVVVTLMQQASEPVLQSITNVVERTIEKVTPTIVERPGKQIIIKDEDLMIAAIERNSPSVVSFRLATEDGTVLLAGIGTVVSSDGLIVTDKGNFGSGVLTTTVGGVQYALEAVSTSKDGMLGLGKLVPVTPLADGAQPATFTPVSFGDVTKLKVGQTAIVLAGRDGKTVVPGLIASIDTRIVVDKDTKVETKIFDNINISQRLASSANGAPIITLDGSVVGFVSINSSIGSQGGIPALGIRELIAESQATSAKKAL